MRGRREKKTRVREREGQRGEDRESWEHALLFPPLGYALKLTTYQSLALSYKL